MGPLGPTTLLHSHLYELLGAEISRRVVSSRPFSGSLFIVSRSITARGTWLANAEVPVGALRFPNLTNPLLRIPPWDLHHSFSIFYSLLRRRRTLSAHPPPVQLSDLHLATSSGRGVDFHPCSLLYRLDGTEREDGQDFLPAGLLSFLCIELVSNERSKGSQIWPLRLILCSATGGPCNLPVPSCNEDWYMTKVHWRDVARK